MQADLALKVGSGAAKIAGDKHETDGEKSGQDPKEKNMDLWNNAVGRKIGLEIQKEIGNTKSISPQMLDDMIAEKVIQRMKKGDLITDPIKDKRLFENSKYNGRVYTKEEIDPRQMSTEEFKNHEKFIVKDMRENKVLTKDQANEQVSKGDLIYVKSYTRDDGTKVKEYYRKK